MDCGEQDEVSMSETISELSQYSEWQDSQERGRNTITSKRQSRSCILC